MKFDHLFFEGIASARPALARRYERNCAAAPAAVLPPDAEVFFASLMGQSALSTRAYRSRALVRRLPACLRFLRAESVDEASRKLAADPRLATAVLNVVLLGVTEFFRDRAVFEKLRTEVLPRLLARHARLRVWSAACSEGHELYSVAMLLAEAGRLGDCELLGTDCRGEAIERARGGLFPSEVLEGMAGWSRRYFTLERSSLAIDPTLRAQVRWELADLLAGAERGPWQLILWRNMAIYLESESAEEIWLRLCDELAPGGFLVAGKADHLPRWLPLQRVASCIYQKAET